MLGALATSHKVGIAVIAGVFIAFALISSFALPSRWPNFPGRRVGLFVAVAALLTAGMLAAVIALAGEPKEEALGGRRGNDDRGRDDDRGHDHARQRKAIPPAARRSSPRRAAARATRSSPPAQRRRSARTWTRSPPTPQKANHGSVDAYVAESVKDPTAYVVPGYPKGVMPSFAA